MTVTETARVVLLMGEAEITEFPPSEPSGANWIQEELLGLTWEEMKLI
jgi:hypothetical protein